MTDRVIALTVILEREIRRDDAELIINGIRAFRGVAKVIPQVSDASLEYVETKVKRELTNKLFKVLE